VCKQSTAADFNPQYRMRRGEFPTLLSAPEHGEVKCGRSSAPTRYQDSQNRKRIRVSPL